MMRSRSFSVVVVGAIMLIGSWLIADSFFRPAPAPPPLDGLVWDGYHSPAQKILAGTGVAGFLLFVAGLLSLAIDGVKRVWKKGS